MGFFEEAVREFETARDTYGYELADATLETYEAALARAHNEEQRTEDGGELPDGVSAAEAGERGSEAHASGRPAPSPRCTTRTRRRRSASSRSPKRRCATPIVRRAKRSARRGGPPHGRAPRRRHGAVALVVVGGLAAAFYGGFGYPTQEQTVTGLLDAYRSGTSYSGFWVAVPVADVAQEMRSLPAKFACFSIQGVDRAPR